MNYKPFVSDFVDHSIDLVYQREFTDEEGNKFITPCLVFHSRYEGFTADSFSIHNRVLNGVGLDPSPALAKAFDRLNGIDHVVDVVESLKK